MLVTFYIVVKKVSNNGNSEKEKFILSYGLWKK